MQLYNKLSAKEREALIDEAGQDRLTISFYQYHQIKNPEIFTRFQARSGQSEDQHFHFKDGWESVTLKFIG